MVQLQSDGTPFKPGQLFDPLTFSYQQASMLNMNGIPGQSLSASNSAAQIQAAQQLSPNIPASSLTPATPLITGNPPQGVDTAGAMVAGATQGVRSFNENLALTTSPDTPNSLEFDRVTDEAIALNAQNVGRGAAQLAAEGAQNLPALNKQVADINAQILAKTAEFNMISAQNQDRRATVNSVAGRDRQNRILYAAEIGMLQATALGLQGQVAAAQATADRAVDLKYDDIEAQYDMKINQLNLLRPKLDKEEKARADALELYLDAQKEASDEKKALDKQFQNLKISAISEGMSVAAAQNAEALFNQGRTDEAYAAMSAFTGSAGGNGDGTTPGTTGFQNSDIESSVREDAVALMDGIETGETTLDKIYDKLRRLYSRTEVSDDALRELLGIVPSTGGTFSSNVPSAPTKRPTRTGRNADTPASRTVEKVVSGITNWFKGF